MKDEGLMLLLIIDYWLLVCGGCQLSVFLRSVWNMTLSLCLVPFLHLYRSHTVVSLSHWSADRSRQIPDARRPAEASECFLLRGRRRSSVWLWIHFERKTEVFLSPDRQRGSLGSRSDPVRILSSAVLESFLLDLWLSWMWCWLVKFFQKRNISR